MRARSPSRVAGSTGVPSTWTEPASGQITPRMSRSRVDLPEPLEPRSTWVVPERTVSDTASRAGVAPKRFVTSWTAITPAFYRKLDKRPRSGDNARHMTQVGILFEALLLS